MAAIGSAIGEPARAKMLAALMDGRALTATELSLEAGVTPSTASTHLARLCEAGLVCVAAQGRHRYFRVATAEVATFLEDLMGIAVRRSVIRTGPRDDGLRRARVCYDHLAGMAGVGLLTRLRERRFIRGDEELVELTGEGEAWLVAMQIEVEPLRRGRRPLLRACLDWSERRHHLAGAIGAALLERLFQLRLAKRDAIGRAVTISDRGDAFLRTLEPPRR